MKVYDLIKQRRSIRKFTQEKVPLEPLKQCVDSARLSPTGANLQPLEFIIVTENLEDFFASTFWAGALKDWNPKKENMPRAYIVILSNTEIKKDCKTDVGIAAQSIVLTALEEGVSSCMLGALNKDELKKLLSIPDTFDLELAIALGYPAQESKTAPFKDDAKYWMDDKETFYVPKRSLDDIMHLNTFKK